MQGKDGSYYNMTPEEQALLNANAGTPATDIKVYYVNYFADGKGKEKPLSGESFPQGQAMQAIYANSVIISANYEFYQTLAHEIGHVLLNNGNHARSIINLMFGAGTNGEVNLKNYIKDAVEDPRRLTEGQTNAIFDNINNKKVLNP